MNILPLIKTDGYKTDHRPQYPDKTELVYSNWTGRKNAFGVPGLTKVVHFGLQGFLKQLNEEFRQNFFDRPRGEVLRLYKRRMNNYMPGNNMTFEHVEALHDLNHLPILVKAIPEGTEVPIRVPMFTIRNTKPEFFWLTNHLETLLSNALWLPCVSATTALHYRRVFEKYAELTGANKSFIPYQGHDFSFRGMGGFDAALTSGAAHLLSFIGTDTIPAIDYLEWYYGADSDKEVIGQSVPATEHSVMCMGGDTNELETFRRLIHEVYPTGVVSIVSDTWDFWKVITKFMPILKDEILARNGKVVIRPDSGDPVKIVCGDREGYFPAEKDSPEHKGAVQCLWETFGGPVNTKGYKELDPHIGIIYGDSITLERQDGILDRLEKAGFASSNIVLGIGSYTYQYKTRDTYGFAMKATYGEIDGKPQEIFKNPKTDSGEKKSAKGLLRVNEDFTLSECVSWEEEATGLLETVFEDGRFVKETTLSEIRARIEAQL